MLNCVDLLVVSAVGKWGRDLRVESEREGGEGGEETALCTTFFPSRPCNVVSVVPYVDTGRGSDGAGFCGRVQPWRLRRGSKELVLR